MMTTLKSTIREQCFMIMKKKAMNYQTANLPNHDIRDYVTNTNYKRCTVKFHFITALMLGFSWHCSTSRVYLPQVDGRWRHIAWSWRTRTASTGYSLSCQTCDRRQDDTMSGTLLFHKSTDTIYIAFRENDTTVLKTRLFIFMFISLLPFQEYLCMYMHSVMFFSFIIFSLSIFAIFPFPVFLYTLVLNVRFCIIRTACETGYY